MTSSIQGQGRFAPRLRNTSSSSARSACRCWCSAGSGDSSRSASGRSAGCRPMRARTAAAAARRCPPQLEQLQPRVERDLAERDDDAHAAQRGDFGVEVRQAVARSPRASACSPAARTAPPRRCRHPQLQPVVDRCDVGMFAKPARWSAAIRKSPEPPTPSPVNTRPVRLAPCAAGARPTISSRAAGSPKPGTGRAQ